MHVHVHPNNTSQSAISMEEPTAPIDWPPNLVYLTQPENSSRLDSTQLKHLKSLPQPLPNAEPLTVVRLPLTPPTHVEIRRIHDQAHPAHNQFGLFATQPLGPGSLVIPYLGLVHSNDDDDTDPTSDYDLSLDREAGLSVDASKMGNEARMTNDYRGVPRAMTITPSQKKGAKLGPNAEFKDLWFEHEDGTGQLGIGIFVLGAGKSGNRAAGIIRGEEVLVNYGKGFWKDRS